MSELHSEVLLSPLGVMKFIAATAHSEFEKKPRAKAQRMMEYAIALAEQRGYADAARLRQLFKQPDVDLVLAEIEPLSHCVSGVELLAAFGIRTIPVEG